MKVAIRQTRGNSGIDFWAQNLCSGIRKAGAECTCDLASPVFEFVPDLRALSKKNDADIVQGNTWNGYAFRAAMPLVVTEHHVVHDPIFNKYKTIPQKIYHRWIRQCEERSLRVADSVVCVSKFTEKRLREVFGYEDAHIIYNGVDTSVFRPKEHQKNIMDIPDGIFVIFFAGNLSNRKGGDLLPSIMKELGDNFLLLIATSKGDMQFAGSPRIRNLGNLHLDQLVRVYNKCDLFLSASRLEGFGLSVAEAMACGKPVVVTDCSSLPELVVDGDGGFLCRMDDVKDFADKIRHISADEGLRREMGIFNRKRVEELFTLERMTDEYIRLYHRLLDVE